MRSSSARSFSFSASRFPPKRGIRRVPSRGVGGTIWAARRGVVPIRSMGRSAGLRAGRSSSSVKDVLVVSVHKCPIGYRNVVRKAATACVRLAGASGERKERTMRNFVSAGGCWPYVGVPADGRRIAAVLAAGASARAAHHHGHDGGVDQGHQHGNKAAAASRSTSGDSSFDNAGMPGVKLYTLSNNHGMTVKITNYGGVIQSIWVPDRRGHVTNVALGFADLAHDVQDVHESPAGWVRERVLRRDHRPLREPDRERDVQAERHSGTGRGARHRRHDGNAEQRAKPAARRAERATTRRCGTRSTSTTSNSASLDPQRTPIRAATTASRARWTTRSRTR